MASDPEPWRSFLRDLDTQLAGPTELHCFRRTWTRHRRASRARYFAGADRGLPLSTTYVPIKVVLTDPVLRPL
jgi:hypothetical protein